MRRTAALLMTVLFISSTIMIVSGQNEEKNIIFEEIIVLEGPFWFSTSCLKVSCSGLTLEINNNGDIISLEDSHQLEWGGNLEEGAIVSLFSSTDLSINDVLINMTLTSPNCPVAEELPQSVKKSVEAIDEVNNVRVDIVWEPPWDMSRMSEVARLELDMM